MPSVPYIPSTAPFTAEQRAWLNGYLAGLFADANVPEEATEGAAAPPPKQEPLLILYGSQTGTAEQIAKRFAKNAEKHGLAPRVLEMNAFAGVDLNRESRLVLITSTWGDGDPPDNAAAFWQYLNSATAPSLEQLHYSVLALGDRNYADFCGAGRKFDERLAQLGAKRIQARADCDVDYETAAQAWMEALWPALRACPGTSEPVISNSVISEIASGAKGASGPGTDSLNTSSTGYTRTHPFPARLLTNRRLNAPGSAKDTRHFEISLKDSGLSYEVGDALGVMPVNCPALVEDLLEALGCDGEEAVTAPSGSETSLRSALLRHFQITQPPLPFLQAVADRSGDEHLKRLLDPANKPDLDGFLYGREIIDLLLAHPAARLSPADFTGVLRALQPRLYSISSSPKAHPGEVHLTVAAVRYECHGRARKGVCSTFLADRVEPDVTPVPVFVQSSPGFRLPGDAGRSVIMIGPGTGIAPFRAFLEERMATGAKGKHWLFFGDQQRASDFLYQDQLEAMLAEGTLARLDTAFSRDQQEKIYVQHRMLENATQFYDWLEAGAHLYVCGDARRMAKDVDAALHGIIQMAGGKSAEQAADYVRRLKSEKRYQRDVY
jgi:sulfite reductase (NADPH) flavoprotein alpha-component